MFVFQKLTAQLYVSPSNFVYVANNYIFVKQDVNLQNNSNFYLRNESQLLQGTAGSSLNNGLGKLSVFQEGTVNNFAYNYWCSPIGVSAGAGNGVFGVSMLNRPTDLTTSVPATLITTFEGSTTNSSLSIASRWIYKFLSSKNYSQWFSVGSASTINAGEGFTMKGSSGTDNTTVLDGRTASGMPSGNGIQNNPTGFAQRYDFRGKPNDGNIFIGVDSGKLTLTGNPYPSAINLNMFLIDNTLAGKISGVAYFWEQDATTNSHTLTDYLGGYGTYIANAGQFAEGSYSAATWSTYNPDGSVNNTPPGPGAGGTYKRMISPIGQGFMVDGTTNGTALMQNSYRIFKKEGVANNSEFHRKANSSEFWEETPNLAGYDYTKYKKNGLPQIKIHTILNNQITKEMVLAFNPESTDGYDIGMDAISPVINLPIDTYFPLDDKNQYVISTLPFDIEKRIPIAVKCDTRTTFKFTVGSLLNFDLSDTIYIYDKLTGEYHDVKNGYYEVDLQTGAKDRFEITFKNASLSTTDSNIIKSFDVLQNNDLNQLTISNPKLVNLKSCSVYDVAGKLVLSKELMGNNYKYVFSTASFGDGLYIVKLNTKDNLEIDKKIIIVKK